MVPEADHSSLTSVEVKNEWSCTSSSYACLSDMGRDNFTFSIFVFWNDIRGILFSWKWELLPKTRS